MSRPSPPRRGFVLIAALAALLIGALWAASAADRLAAAARGARMVDQASQDQVRVQNALAATILLAASAPHAPCGLQPKAAYVESEFMTPGFDEDSPCLRFDESMEPIAGGWVMLQDAAGLISTRLPNELFARSFLAASGAFRNGPSIDPVQALRDFGDLNDEALPYGGEARAYRQDDKPPPPNRWPRTPYDAFDAMSWERAAVPAVADRLSVGLQPSLNVNAAPAELLSALSPFDQNDAQALIEARRRFGFTGAEFVAQAVDGRLPDDPFVLSYLPSRTLRARIVTRADAGFVEASITLYPAEEQRLWSLDYLLTAPQRTFDVDGSQNGAGVSRVMPDGYGPWLDP